MKYWRAAYTGQYSVVNRSSHANRYFTSCKRVPRACSRGASIFFQCTRQKQEYKEKVVRGQEEGLICMEPIFPERTIKQIKNEKTISIGREYRSIKDIFV